MGCACSSTTAQARRTRSWKFVEEGHETEHERARAHTTARPQDGEGARVCVYGRA